LNFASRKGLGRITDPLRKDLLGRLLDLGTVWVRLYLASPRRKARCRGHSPPAVAAEAVLVLLRVMKRLGSNLRSIRLYRRRACRLGWRTGQGLFGLLTSSGTIALCFYDRMVCRMNLTHTVLDLRNFINAYVLYSFCLAPFHS
jgi:hypothetical protein